MASPVVVITLGIGVIFHATFAFPFALNNYGEQGSVQGSSRNCCDSVEYWLRNSASSKSELPSFEELTPNRERIPGNTKEMSRTRNKCKLLVNNPGSIKTKNILDSYKQVGLSKEDSNCLSFWMECNGVVMCIGLSSTDFIQSTNRKLLMVAVDDQDENNIQAYSFVLTGFVLCAMVVLVALCGSSVKNRPMSEIYTGEEEVEVLSSVKVKSIREKDNSLSEVAVKQENQNEVVEKDKQVADIEIDRNSNRSPTTPTSSATDPGLDVVAIDDKNVNKNDINTTDGAACSKNLPKEEKRKVSKKDKAMRSKRSRTNPNPEVKGFSKIKQSLRRHSDDTKPFKKDKKSKKRSTSESTSPPSSPTTPLDSIGFQTIGNDRRSFLSRELPQRPTADDNYSEPFDSMVRTRVTSEDLEEEENYERVINTTTAAQVSAKDEIRRSYQSSAEGTEQWSITNEQGEEVLYDSVDEKQKYQSVSSSKGSNNPSKVYPHSDTYESVENEALTKENKSNEAFAEELYEDVDKRNILDIYDEPKTNITRKRSASDVSRTSSTYRESEQKTKSLERGKREVKPEPPPIEKISIAKMLHETSRMQEPIDWYTSTTKKGDYIVQEDKTTVPVPVSQHKPLSPTLSNEQLETMYAKVDKEKRKRDRLESRGKEEDVGKSGADTKIGDTSISNGDVHEDENEYEIILTLPRKSVLAKEGEEVVEHHGVVNIQYV